MSDSVSSNCGVQLIPDSLSDPLADPEIGANCISDNTNFSKSASSNDICLISSNSNHRSKTARAEILISGMTCTMCSQAVETALRNKLPNIVSVEINLTTDSAEVEWIYDDNDVKRTSLDAATSATTASASSPAQVLNDIREIIGDIGYEVEEARLLRIPATRASNRMEINDNDGPLLPSSTNYSRLHEDKDTTTSNESYSTSNDVFGKDNISSNNNNNTIVADVSNTVASPANHSDDNYEDEEETVEERWQRYRDRQKRKLLQKRRAFLISLAGTVPILTLTMILPYIINTDAVIFHHKHVTIFHKYNLEFQSIVLWLLATPVQFFCGWEFYKMAWYGFRSGKAGMDLLVALGTTASYGYAVVGVLWEEDHAAHFFETSAVLICFVLAGKWMQAVAVHRTSDALSQLMQLQCKTAIKVTPSMMLTNNGKNSNNQLDRLSLFDPLKDPYIEEIVDIHRVKVNDLVKVIRGASVPTDGRILFGEILVDESMVTGESMPVLKTAGSPVLGGTVCVETTTTGTVTTTNSGTSFARAVEVENNTTHSAFISSSSSGNISSSDDNQDEQQEIGAAFILVTGVGSTTALAQIVKMVQRAQTRSVPIQSFADSISAVFVPTVCAISVITYLVWYALCSSDVVPASWYEAELGEDAATFSLMFAIACLVISCPCALGLATPTAVMVGTGVGASKCGVLMKGGQALEIASQVDSVVLDKTGTLTKGTPAVSDFVRIDPSSDGHNVYGLEGKSTKSGDNDPLANVSNGLDNNVLRLSDNYLLWLLASIERTSEHPLAKAVVTYAQERLGQAELDLHPLAQPTHFRAMTGRGCKGSVLVDLYNNSAFPSDSTAKVVVGNRSYAEITGVTITQQAHDCMTIFEQQGKTAIFGAVDGTVCVVLAIADELKPDAKAAIYYLREQLKIDVWMVTGDNARTASAVAQLLDMSADRVISEALPATKLAIVRRLQQEGRVVAMVGDGVNDSPALAQADVGMSLGSGASEIAAEASDMVLVKGDMASVCTAIHLSRAIFRRIQWNFVWSLLYNCLGIPVAAGVFYPFVHARLPPTVAALAMALSSISVVLSSLTLRLYRPPDVYEEWNSQNDRRRSRRRNHLRLDTASLIGTEQGELRMGLLSNDHLAASESTVPTDNRSLQQREEA